MYVNGPKKQHFELLKDGAKEELHTYIGTYTLRMSLVTAVIMQVKLFILATQISSLLRTVINILKEDYYTISVAIRTLRYCGI